MTNGLRMVASLLAVLIFPSLSATAWAGPHALPRPQAAPAVITSPQPFTPLRGRVSISGTAVHPDLWKYEVHFAPEPGTGDQWSLIGSVHEVPVVDGLLEVWDTTTVPDGAYSLRLRVVRRDGNYEEVFLRQVWVANAQPTETPAPEVSPTPTSTPTPSPPPTVVMELPVIPAPTPEVSPTTTTTPMPSPPTVVIEQPVTPTPTPYPTPTPMPPGDTPAAVSGHEEVWGQPQNLSVSLGRSWLPRVAADRAGNVHVVWTEGYCLGCNDGSIYYRMWDGAQWSERVKISTEETEYALLPSIAVDADGWVHVIYTGIWGHPESAVYHTRAHIEAGPADPYNWSPPVAVGVGTASYWTDLIVGHDGSLHAVWEGSSADDSHGAIYYARSDDGGAEWTLPKDISPRSGSNRRPRVTTDAEGGIHVAWEEMKEGEVDYGFRIWYASSSDGGQSWTSPIVLNRGQGTGDGSWVAIAADGANNIHVTYQGRAAGVGGRYHQWSADGGVSWSPPFPIAASEVQGQVRPASGDGWADLVVGDDGTLHTVAPGGGALWYTRWQGERWTPPVQVYTTPDTPRRPRLAMGEGNRLHLVWYETGFGGEGFEVFYLTGLASEPSSSSLSPTPPVHSTPVGPLQAQPEVWSSPANVSDSAEPSQFPRVAVDRAGNLHVVWVEAWADQERKGSIFYAMWAGDGWSQPIRVSTDATEPALLPAIAVAPDGAGTIHVVFAGGSPNGTYLCYTQANAAVRPADPGSWSSPSPVLDSLGADWSDVVADLYGGVHVAWTTDGPPGVYYAMSSDEGWSWQDLAETAGDGQSRGFVPEGVRLAIDNRGRIFTAWHEGRAEPIYRDGVLDLARRTYAVLATGVGRPEWAFPTVVDSTGRWIRVIIDGNNDLHLTWCGSAQWYGQTAVGQLYQRVSLAGTRITDWSGPVYVYRQPDGGGCASGAASVAFDTDGYLHLATVGGGQLYHLWSDGLAWSEPTAIAPRSSEAGWPEMAIGEGNRVHVVWVEKAAGGTSSDIFHSSYLSQATHLAAQPNPTPTSMPPPTSQPTPQLPSEPAPTPSPGPASVVITPAPGTPASPPDWKANATTPLLNSVAAVIGLVAVLLVARWRLSGESRFWRRMRRGFGGRGERR